ncbi:MAG TPA: hypothetical protein PKA41_17375, partial [Verrucomicrobiota bacterium]|nr:hypothetical protein [Verrucomicrobiota bacterium]
MATKIQLVLEGQDQASAAVRKVNDEVVALGQSASVAGQQTATLNTTLNAGTANAAAKAATATATLGKNAAQLRAGFGALRGVLTVVGLQTFPQLTGTMMVATSAMSGLKNQAGLTTASLAKLGVVAAVLAATSFGTVKSFEKLWAAENRLAETEALVHAQRQLREHIKLLGETGEISGNQMEKFLLQLTSPKSFEDLARLRKEIKSVMDARSPATGLDLARARAGILSARRGTAEAQGDITVRGDSFMRENADELAEAYAQINRELAKQQRLLQDRLELGDEDIRQNLEWLDLQAQREDAMASAAEIARAQRDRERAINEQRLDGVRNMFGDMATAAKVFGREGLIAYKAFATAAALIDTYKSAVAAFSAVAGIPLIGPALAPAAAAAAVAAGLANVAMINSQSFAEGGFTWHGRKYEPAGKVHRGQFVVAS